MGGYTRHLDTGGFTSVKAFTLPVLSSSASNAKLAWGPSQFPQGSSLPYAREITCPAGAILASRWLPGQGRTELRREACGQTWVDTYPTTLSTTLISRQQPDSGRQSMLLSQCNLAQASM